jgi:hypothetical protein
VSTSNAIAAVIHDQLGQVLTTVLKSGGKSPFEIHVNPNDGLLQQLQEPGDAAPRVSLTFKARRRRPPTVTYHESGGDCTLPRPTRQRRDQPWI